MNSKTNKTCKHKRWINVTIYCQLYYLFFAICTLCFSHEVNAALIAGNPKGKITVVDFFDYQCPHCQRMAIILEQLMHQETNVRVVYKATPVLNQTSWLLARAVLAAQYQNRALAFHHLLLESSPGMHQEQLFYLAQKAKLNPQLFMHTLYKPAITAELQHNLADLQTLRAVGVPVLLIGYTAADKPAFVFNGETTLTALQQAIQQLQ